MQQTYTASLSFPSWGLASQASELVLAPSYSYAEILTPQVPETGLLPTLVASLSLTGGNGTIEIGELSEAVQLALAPFYKGDPGSGGGGSIAQPAVYTDYSNSQYCYLGYPNYIARLNYSVSPVLKQSAATVNLNADWPNRVSLSYS